jgi:hypothetical protein
MTPDHRRSPTRFDDGHVGEPHLAEQRGDGPRTALDVGGVAVHVADRRDSHQVLEPASHPGQSGGDGRAEVVGPGIGSHDATLVVAALMEGR